jgi:hypothetical protein
MLAGRYFRKTRHDISASKLSGVMYLHQFVRMIEEANEAVKDYSLG